MKSSLGVTDKFLRKRLAIVGASLLTVDYLYHDSELVLKNSIVKKIRSSDSVPAKDTMVIEELAKENLQKLHATNSQSEKVNVVFGSKAVGKSTALALYAHQKAEEKRPVFYLRIGSKDGNGSASCDLESQVMNDIGVPSRSSLVETFLHYAGLGLDKIMGITHERIVSDRMEFTIKLLFESVDQIYREDKEALEQKIFVRRPPGFIVPDGYESCRPVVIIDEGDCGLKVTTPGHDDTRVAITRAVLREMFDKSSLHKNFEAWVSGSDSQLIEECCVKYKRAVYPITKFNTITLKDPSSEVMREVFRRLEFPHPSAAGQVLFYDEVAIDRIIEVFGTRVSDLVTAKFLQVHHSSELLERKVGFAVAAATTELNTLISAHGSSDDQTKMTSMFNLLAAVPFAASDDSSAGMGGVVTLNDLIPAGSKIATSPTFKNVIYSQHGKLSFQRPIYRFAWLQDSRADKSVAEWKLVRNSSNKQTIGNNGGGGEKSWWQMLFGY